MSELNCINASFRYITTATGSACWPRTGLSWSRYKSSRIVQTSQFRYFPLPMSEECYWRHLRSSYCILMVLNSLVATLVVLPFDRNLPLYIALDSVPTYLSTTQNSDLCLLDLKYICLVFSILLYRRRYWKHVGCKDTIDL